MTFEQYLIENKIPFKKEGEEIWVEDSDLLAHIDQILKQFPEVEIDLIGSALDGEIDDFEVWDALIDLDELNELDELEDLDSLNDLEDWENEDEDWEEYWGEGEEE